MEYNVILQRMLARLPSRYDKREGSVLYTLLAPVAWAIAQCHYILSWAVSLVFPDTATGDFLDLSCSAFGLDRSPDRRLAAAPAVWATAWYTPEESSFSI